MKHRITAKEEEKEEKEPRSLKIRNPLTGRWILQGGPTDRRQQREKRSGIEIRAHRLNDNDVPSSLQEKGGSQSSPPDSLDPLSFPVDRDPLVSWKQKKPSSVSERRRVLQKCGSSCFLLPKQKKFPICNKQLPCTYNCRGLKASSARAGQWKYLDVLKRSKALTKELGCYDTISTMISSSTHRRQSSKIKKT